jgi:hypothetical protein
MASLKVRVCVGVGYLTSTSVFACGGDEFTTKGANQQIPRGGSGNGAGAGGGGASASDGSTNGGGSGSSNGGFSGDGGLIDGGFAGSVIGGSGGGAGTSGGGAGGARGGDGGTSGSGNGGSGGVVQTSCQAIADCPAGSYCRPAIGCVSCEDMNRVSFGPPEMVEAISGTAAGNQRFPRPTHNPGELFFRTGAYNERGLLWQAPDMTTTTGITQFGSPVDVATESASGPLEMLDTITGVGNFNFFFDRTSDSGAKRDLYGAARNGGTNVTNVTRLSAPINSALAAITPHNNWSIAMAPEPQRVWWMTNRNDAGGSELVTVSTGNLVATLVTINLAETSGCVRTGFDATPWVTLDGIFMFFRSIEIDPTTCTLTNDVHDLFVVRLNDQGQPAANAVLLDAPSFPDEDETDPALSPDRCWLYFASDGGAPDYEYDVYRSPRN